MRNAVGLSIIVMLICFNAGLFLVDASGLYAGVKTPSGESPESGLSGGESNIDYITVSLLSISTIAGFGLGFGMGLVAPGVDPLRCGGLTAFIGGMIGIFRSSYLVIDRIVDNLAPNSVIGSAVALVFIGFCSIIIFIFVLQLLLGGWATTK